ncbi:pilus assembly protein TadG-related protein [Rosistilla oblonga]|uniref:Putative Flp pilus-assembly TadG-like N-terminal domain-containing protein n=1 Tax=Rosistilla oblonga TaxID=2527990 RepID=A0A518ILY6_9BACT|nr:pilus assembly protein TadG-related protein [Rosistilla oblonga]QDV54075.1 hypothetical protein Mal33_00160 [Rosistilla oblonga]
MNTHAKQPSSLPARQIKPAARTGKVFVFLCVALPGVFAVLALVFDAGLMMTASRDYQNTTDAAAYAAATWTMMGGDENSINTISSEYVQSHNALPGANVTTNSPPSSGPYQGVAGFSEVIVQGESPSYFLQRFAAGGQQSITTRAVAGTKTATSPAAIMLLDADPAPITVASILSLPLYPSLLGGLEVLGLGSLTVDGAVLSNNTWGGVDEYGEKAGESHGPPYSIACTPLVPLTALRASDIRTAGGVDRLLHYDALPGLGALNLRANRMPMPDPMGNLAPPSTASDPDNVEVDDHGGVMVTLNILKPFGTVLEPGVYDWIDVTAGIARFEPGVYIIRGKHPITGIALGITGGIVYADGVMFYVTSNSNYDPASGLPDAVENREVAPPNTIGAQLPSVLISPLPGSRLSGLNDPSSPYHGMLVYQRPRDRRPITILSLQTLGITQFSGTVYSRWGHAILAGSGTFNSSFAVGTMRVVTLGNISLRPSGYFPAASDVYLVE